MGSITSKNQSSLPTTNNASTEKQLAAANLTPIQSLTTDMAANKNVKRVFLFKILLLGNCDTGKTALFQRYIRNLFPKPSGLQTIDAEFGVKIVKYEENMVIRLQLWDFSSRVVSSSMARVFYKDVVGCFIVFDVTRGSTFEAVTKRKTDLDSKVQLPDGNPVPCILLANKCDLAKEGLVNNAQQMDEFCREKGFIKWFQTSAKENINVEESFQFLINEIMKLPEEIRSFSMQDKLDIKK